MLHCSNESRYDGLSDGRIGMAPPDPRSACMRTLSDTIARLAAFRGAASMAMPPATAAPLAELSDFGSNPGKLGAWYHVPQKVRAKPPLVVVLHGCTQTAAGYNHGSGWSQL
eukprot:gene65989-90300_t